MEFPKNIDKSIKKVCQEYRLNLEINNHYNATNREIIWFEGNIRKRINFEIGSGMDFDITFYKDTFPFFPRVLIFLHEYLSCKMYCKTEWKDLDGFVSLDKEVEYYYEKIASYMMTFRGEN